VRALGTVAADNAEYENRRVQNMVRDAQNVNEQAHHGHVQGEKDDVADIHAGDKSPEGQGVFRDEQRAGFYAVDHDGCQKNGGDGPGGEPHGQHGDEGADSG